MSYPPLLFDHPAIYKTSWRAGETIALVYNYAKTHTLTHVSCRRETLGIIFLTFQTFSTFCKESLGIIFQLFQHSAKNRLGTNMLFKMFEQLDKLEK